MDHEKGIGHNRLLYSVWNEKTNLMKIAADINPFSSSYFVWQDIGAMSQVGTTTSSWSGEDPRRQAVSCSILSLILRKIRS